MCREALAAVAAVVVAVLRMRRQAQELVIPSASRCTCREAWLLVQHSSTCASLQPRVALAVMVASAQTAGQALQAAAAGRANSGAQISAVLAVMVAEAALQAVVVVVAAVEATACLFIPMATQAMYLVTPTAFDQPLRSTLPALLEVAAEVAFRLEIQVAPARTAMGRPLLFARVAPKQSTSWNTCRLLAQRTRGA